MKYMIYHEMNKKVVNGKGYNIFLLAYFNLLMDKFADLLLKILPGYDGKSYLVKMEDKQNEIRNT